MVSSTVADVYLEGLLKERALNLGDADRVTAIDAEIERVGGTPPAAPPKSAPAGKPGK